ncbi:MAG: ATP-binding protein [Desulfobulbaceae bacterium]|nr:ATP-binding protein [Desulfobulbaceae bacterium]
MKRTVENRKQVITIFLDDQRELLSQLMRLYSYDDLKDQTQLERIFAAVAATGFIVDMDVIDAAGRHVAYVGPYREKLIGKIYKNEKWFKDVMLKGKHISDVFLGYREVPHFVMAVADPQRKWVLRATINSEFFNNLLQSAWIGETGDAFVVNRKGELQTPSRFGDNSLSAGEKTLLVYHEGTAVIEIDEFIYVTSWLKNREWLLIVKLRTSSVLEIFYYARNMDFLTISIAILVVVTVATLIAHLMVNKLEMADRERVSLDSQMLQVEKMASLGRMAAGVAHEINNPLQLITDQAGWIGELLDEEDPQILMNFNEYRKAIDKIKSHVARASGVTHRLLGFSRKMDAEKAAVNINRLIEEVISFLENEAFNNHIAINKHLQKDMPAIMTDAAQIQQVLLNILNNSMDAIEKNGAIDITSQVEGQNIILTFEDTGPGIRPEIMDKIFDPFFTTKAPGKGTGLGLSICYTIIQSLGGKIEIQNRKKGGAVFTVKLPVVKQGNRLT